MQFLRHLNWRYATKAMNGKEVSADKIDTILESVILAPTSSGLQPYQVLVIKGKELKEKILPLANGQTVVTDCSHLLIFAAWDTYTEARVNRAFENMFEARGFNERWDGYRKYIIDLYVNRPAEENFVHTARQAYIGFGFAIAAAATEEVDATPMEGFDNDGLDALLGLREKGLRSVTLLPLGYRDVQTDWIVDMKKVRMPKDEFIIELD
jgi:nitroreductase